MTRQPGSAQEFNRKKALNALYSLPAPVREQSQNPLLARRPPVRGVSPFLMIYRVLVKNIALTRFAALAAVAEHLAACCNIVTGVRSIFQWEGKTCDEEEALLIIKTRTPILGTLQERVQELHGYDVPEIIALPVVQGSADYLNWVREQTRQKARPGRVV